MNAALLVDFGSTYTKVRAVDLDAARVIAAAQGPSTVTTDVSIGLDAALSALAARLGGRLPGFRHRLGCSSAAGGLRMVTVGLVRELTAEAARQAALGAGAKLAGSFCYRLTAADGARIAALEPDVVLLTGGTDGGNTEVIAHNARVLAGLPICAPVVVAGNREAADDVAATLRAAGKTVTLADNVMPDLGTLAIDAARAAIRALFMERIVHSKGIDRACRALDGVLMPTPAAVLEGARLLAEGPGGRGGLGPLVVVDPGGATTDVHSVASGEPAQPGVIPVGLPEPHAKRTVEGDLGMRHNAASILDAVGLEAIAADAGLAAEHVAALVARMGDEVERLPADADERALDLALGRAALRVAMRRHAGTLETVYTANGPVQVQRGKDLSAVRHVVGTGGVVVASPAPARMLAPVLADASDPTSLRPRAAKLHVDRDYALFGAGLLAQVAPDAAYRLALRGLTEVVTEDRDGQRASA
jgi:uncharacterized protein (TIGR01319 family)